MREAELVERDRHPLGDAVEAVNPGDEGEIFFDRQVFVKREALRHIAGLALDRFRLAREVEPEHLAMAAVGRQQSAQDAQRCGLARAVWAEEAGDMPLLNL